MVKFEPKFGSHIPRIHIKIMTKWQNTFFDLRSIGMCRRENVISAF